MKLQNTIKEMKRKMEAERTRFKKDMLYIRHPGSNGLILNLYRWFIGDVRHRNERVPVNRFRLFQEQKEHETPAFKHHSSVNGSHL